MSLLDFDEAILGTGSLGDSRRTLRIGSWTIKFSGLDAASASNLDRGWGGFVADSDTRDVDASVWLLAAGEGSFLEAKPGEVYRIESSGNRMLSYHLAARRYNRETWRAAIAASSNEPREQILNNLARLLVARVALRAGGLPLHGAGIVIGEQAFIFAGASRAGKSTAAVLARPDRSLGDDFAIIVPHASGFAAIPVPFDNTCVAPAGPATTLVPLAGVFRLEHSTGDPRIVRKTGPHAVASLLGAAAFPAAVPDLASGMLEPAEAIVGAGLFGVISFGLDTDVRALIQSEWQNA